MVKRKPLPYQKIVAQIKKNVATKTWECLHSGCEKKAINSHLLQRKGILSAITENGHVIEMRPKDIFQWDANNPPLEFKSVGIKHAISHPLFCNDHDASLFQSIETEPLDFGSYSAQLLLSYRALISEIRVKQVNLLVNERTLNSQTLKGQIDSKTIEIFIEGTKKGLEDLRKYQLIIEKEIQESTQSFHFEKFTYPLIEVYASSAFSPLDGDKFNPLDELPLNSIFIHVIPYDSTLNIEVGFNKEYSSQWISDYVESWRDLEFQELGVKLTELFATRIENWGLSPSLFNSMPKKSLTEFIEYWNENAMNLSINQRINFNIFSETTSNKR